MAEIEAPADVEVDVPIASRVSDRLTNATCTG